MGDLIDHVTNPANLCWAWRKAQRMYEDDDILTDDLEVSEFEMNLESSLALIAEDLRSGKYALSPLTLMPHPKAKDESGSHRIRQSFRVAVRDQVAWIAVVNIIGPGIEERMPQWSYGNRLYRQVFFEPAFEGVNHLRFGHFRHASGRLYRPFHQAWPLYRRHILFTARAMSKNKIAISERDDELFQIDLKANRLSFLKPEWWTSTSEEVHWASVDFSKFYPSVNLDVISKNLARFSDYPDEDVANIIRQLLFFPILTNNWSKEALSLVGIAKNQTMQPGIPTGLFVGGFLANTAMLDIDEKVDSILHRRQIAQFRYVDDHTILAPTFSALDKWMDEYDRILSRSGLGVSINYEKTHPQQLREFRTAKSNNEITEVNIKSVALSTKIDIRAPTPLITRTLAKVSMIATTNIDLQTPKEQDTLLADILQLLLTEFPAHELRPETRMSFAMSQLCRVAADHFLLRGEICDAEEKLSALMVEREHPSKVELAHLQSQLKLIVERVFSGIFQHVELTLQRYPDRPRLWAKAVRFCRTAGYGPGLKSLYSLLSSTKDLHPLSVGYLKSYITQRINRNFITSISTLTSDKEPLSRRKAALRFANSCYDLMQNVGPLEKDDWEVVRIFFEIRASYWMLSKILRSKVRDAYDLEETFAFLNQEGLLSKLPSGKKPSVFGRRVGRLTSLSRWYIDKEITTFAATEPSFYWRQLSVKLSPKVCYDSLLLSKWPCFLPKGQRMAILEREVECSPERSGWLFDVWKGTDSTINGDDAVLLRRFRLPKRVSDSYLTLNEWVEFANSLPKADPRRSEWTALEVLRQTLDCALKFQSTKKSNPDLIPQNILIPRAWLKMDVDRKCHSWESWGRASTRSRIKLRTVNSVRDDRYYPFWRTEANQVHIPEAWERAYSCGLVLAGLLRLSFGFPSIWNPVGQLRLWSGRMGAFVRNLYCSSWTLAIVQATVMPRNRETFLLRLFAQSKFCQDDDTVDDPPDIDNIDVMRHYIGQAQKVLTDYRVTVQDHKPRQLVPLSLDQISKELFEHVDLDSDQ